MSAPTLQMLSAFWADLQHLHLLRPHWLWAWLALPPLIALWAWRRRRAGVWREVVDAHLLPHLLVAGTRGSWLLPAALALAFALAVLALAGPSWRQQAEPMFRSRAPLVIALDLSPSILAGDLPPSRLLQARAKLATLLRERAGGEVALLAYAGESFTVAPLTDDGANVALFLDALSPAVMPVDGKRADRAIEAAMHLLSNAGANAGDILLLTDSADGRARALATAAARRGLHVSVLGLGTAAGAAYRDGNGEIAQSRLDEAGLQALAQAGNGRYARLAVDDADLRALGVLDPGQDQAEASQAEGMRGWRDDGYWLLPAVMLLALLGFRRRRGVAAALLAALLLPQALPAPAAEAGTLWRRGDQVAQQRVARGVQAYRGGDYAAAQQAFDGIDSDEAQYNLGNALARQGQYDAAIAAYDRALALHPQMPDALANRAAVEAARKRQQQNGNGGKQGQHGNQDKQQGQAGQGQPSPGQQDPKQGPQPGPQPGRQPGQSGPSRDGQQPPPKPGDAGNGAAPGQPRDGKAGQGQPQGEDANAQQQADRAQQQRMQQALREQQAGKPGQQAQAAQETPQQREQRQAVEAWMRRVPDDPGSLLRTKFRLEYERRQREGQ